MFLEYVFYVIFCIYLLIIYMLGVVDQLPRLGKIICLLLFTCVFCWRVSSSSVFLGLATLFYCGTF